MKGAKAVNKFGKVFVAKTIYGKDFIPKLDINVANMNVFEFIYFWLFHWHSEGIFKEWFEYLCDVLTSVVMLIIATIVVVSLPISLPIYAFYEIKRTREKLNHNKGE